ncbi:hypothetical protein GQ53DRAFT_771074 [Thozetella sp. PMI_491]|nr:hypothetical protein GQ53DRAFT_771074 [Thozetella sp. PMI_491]
MPRRNRSTALFAQLFEMGNGGPVEVPEEKGAELDVEDEFVLKVAVLSDGELGDGPEEKLVDPGPGNVPDGTEPLGPDGVIDGGELLVVEVDLVPGLLPISVRVEVWLLHGNGGELEDPVWLVGMGLESTVEPVLFTICDEMEPGDTVVISGLPWPDVLLEMLLLGALDMLDEAEVSETGNPVELENGTGADGDELGTGWVVIPDPDAGVVALNGSELPMKLLPAIELVLEMGNARVLGEFKGPELVAEDTVNELFGISDEALVVMRTGWSRFILAWMEPRTLVVELVFDDGLEGERVKDWEPVFEFKYVVKVGGKAVEFVNTLEVELVVIFTVSEKL